MAGRSCGYSDALDLRLDVGGDRLPARQAILDHQLDGFSRVAHGLVVGVALGAYLGQRRDGNDEPAFC